MITLTKDECRVLGVLVEKALTTPAQYPLTLNAVTLGCNQKNNRDPVTNFTEERVFDAMDKLRQRGLARELMLSGSRVPKFRHMAREVMEVATAELVLLTELMLRGPQTVGELRGRATRMHPIESLEEAQTILEGLMKRPEPMVKELPPAPGSRAKRYVQLLCPDLHPLDHVSAGGGGEEFDEAPARGAGGGGVPSVNAEVLMRVERLEAEVQTLRLAIQKLASSVGEADPLA
jgi:uncharacterized protein YceH (UPF0502 family)